MGILKEEIRKAELEETMGILKEEIRKAELEETIENLQWSLDVNRKDLMRKTIEKAIAIIQEFGINDLT